MGDTTPPGAGRRAMLPPGLVPRYLSREEAAAYLGVSVDTFEREVELGWWPAARRRGAHGTRLTWDRLALDAAADQASGLAAQPEAAAAAERNAAEAAAIAGVRHATSGQQRPQHRPPAAR